MTEEPQDERTTHHPKPISRAKVLLTGRSSRSQFSPRGGFGAVPSDRLGERSAAPLPRAAAQQRHRHTPPALLRETLRLHSPPPRARRHGQPTAVLPEGAVGDLGCRAPSSVPSPPARSCLVQMSHNHTADSPSVVLSHPLSTFSRALPGDRSCGQRPHDGKLCQEIFTKMTHFYVAWFCSRAEPAHYVSTICKVFSSRCIN